MSDFLQIIQKPAIIIAIVAFIGLVAMRSKPSKVIVGTTLSFVGFTMIKMGSALIAGTLTGFSTLFNSAFHLQGIVPSNEAMMAMTMKSIGSTAALVLVVGLVVNLLAARFTPFKSVYLSLHLALFTAFAIAAVAKMIGLNSVFTITAGGILLGLYMSISPTILGKFTKDVTGSDEFTIAHSGSLSYILGALLARKFGNKKHDAENIKMNDSILFLKDPNVATTLTMLILFLVTSLLAHGDAAATKVLAGENPILYSMEQAATFAGGLFVVKAGIKMFIDEIVPAFKGFAKIVAPGAIPGVDVLVLFDKAPNTALIGFLTSFATGLVALFLLPVLGLPVIVPGLMACFITGGASAILGNAEGGIRGAIISAVTDGVLLAFMPALAMALFAALGIHGTTFADPDMISVAAIFWVLFRWF
ncbi:PTS ascorbate transporter subunit IIC [Lacticaseibacillus sp. GG6-2]